jgi:PII-like signaling protein
MNQIRLYIGADNQTRTISEEYYRKTVKILNKELDGYTIFRGNGIWKGNTEDTIIVEIINEKIEKIEKIAETLKKELNQEAILITQEKVSFKFL